jgi:DNA (cytosine-5)-methyltransferase 1
MDMLPARTPEHKAANKGKGGYANVRETVVNDLLPTTRAQNGEDRNNKIYARDPSQPQNLENALAVTMLPTPMSRDWKGDTAPHERDGVVQTDSVERAIFHSGEVLLGTPQARDSKGRPGRQQDKNLNHDVARQDLTTNWGKFEPAIRRWEKTLGRPAPSPTKPDGKEGNHRLSSAFTEWMMGLPSGWITEVGLSRNDELKACGNGVVPQQAELALRALLEGVAIPSGGGK